MVIGFAFFVVAVLIVGVWFFIEVKRTKHKLFAIFLIALILFSYISATAVFRGKNIQWNSVSGLMEGVDLYFSWLGSVFGNLKSITSYAVKMDWDGNETTEKNNSGGFMFSPSG